MNILTHDATTTEHPHWCDPRVCFGDGDGDTEHRTAPQVMAAADHTITVAIARQDETLRFTTLDGTPPGSHLLGQALIRLHVAFADPAAPTEVDGLFAPHPVHGRVDQLAPHLTPEDAEALAEALMKAARVARSTRDLGEQ